MSNLQAITSKMILLASDEELIPIMTKLFHALATRNAFTNDTEYLHSIPGYWENAQEIASAPDSEWLDESEVEW